MCEFASFCVDIETGAVLAGDWHSHSATAELLGLQPDTYREGEWPVDDDGQSLTVRTMPDDPHNASWYKTAILVAYKTRAALLAAHQCNRGPGGAMYHNARGQRHRTDGPAVELANGARVWCLNDRLHRPDGPAIERADGTREWWLNGQRRGKGVRQGHGSMTTE